MNPDELTRLPPQDRAAEICVLGAMILDASRIDEATAIVTKADFFSPAHGLIFDLLVRMHADDQPIDLVTVKAAALEAGILEQIGGVDYLLALVDGVPMTSNVAHYAGIVQALALKRSLLRYGQTVLASAYEPTVTAAELAALAESQLDAIVTGRSDDRLTTAQEAAECVLRDVQAAEQGDSPPGLMTGLEAIDTASGGLRGGELVVVAGPTGSGKTTLADTIAVNVAEAGGRVLIASVEMLADERAQRLLQIIGQVDGSKMRQPKRLAAEDWTALYQATEALRAMKIDLVTGELTTADIVGAAKRTAKRRGGLDLIVVDYLQLLTPAGDPSARRAEQVSKMAWACKMQLAVTLRVPVLLLSQFRREDESKDLLPRKSWLKESGDIENHANVIWLLWKPDPGGKNATLCEQDEVMFCQDKHRSMPLTPWTGRASIRLRWSRRTTTFTAAYRAWGYA